MQQHLPIAIILLAGCVADELDPLGPQDLTTATGAFTISLIHAPDPPAAGDAELRITLSDDAGPISGAAIDVTPWMPDHSHGADPPVVDDLGEGGYRAAWVYPMSGYWEITLDISADGTTDNAMVVYEVL